MKGLVYNLKNIFVIMPARLKIKIAKPMGERGTTSATELVDLLDENWSQVQEKFGDLSESDKQDMLDHFNASVEDIGEALFGEGATIDELRDLVSGLDPD